jgi:predicted Zn-dependent protease
MKYLRSLVVACVLLLARCPDDAFAEIRRYEAEDIQFDTPDGWSVHETPDELVFAHEGGVAIVVDVIEGVPFQEATAAIIKRLGELDTFKLTRDFQADTLNGLEARFGAGAATTDSGEALELSIILL